MPYSNVALWAHLEGGGYFGHGVRGAQLGLHDLLGRRLCVAALLLAREPERGAQPLACVVRMCSLLVACRRHVACSATGRFCDRPVLQEWLAIGSVPISVGGVQ